MNEISKNKSGVQMLTIVNNGGVINVTNQGKEKSP
jgi:hypothetical protein